MKKVIICVTILVAMVFAGCYAWFGMGLSQAINEKTLNVSYDEIANNEILEDIEFNKTYEGGLFFDKYTEYTGISYAANQIEAEVNIRVDNSTQEVEQISVSYKRPNTSNEKELNEYFLSSFIDASLRMTFLANYIDNNLTDSMQSDITSTINPIYKNRLKEYDSCTYNGIRYSMSTLLGYGFTISPEK